MSKPIISVVVNELTMRIESVHRTGDEPKLQDAKSTVQFSKEDVLRMKEFIDNLPKS